VYEPEAREPFVLISASSSNPRPSGKPTEDKPEIIEGPGIGWAFVICDQLAILYTPLEYCRATVLPKNLVVICISSDEYFIVPTYVGKLSILEYNEIMFSTEFLQTVNERMLVIFNDIDVSLLCQTL
jgi:hypothetical protein